MPLASFWQNLRTLPVRWYQVDGSSTLSGTRNWDFSAMFSGGRFFHFSMSAMAEESAKRGAKVGCCSRARSTRVHSSDQSTFFSVGVPPDATAWVGEERVTVRRPVPPGPPVISTPATFQGSPEMSRAEGTALDALPTVKPAAVALTSARRPI